jgi:Ni,Fe-hydrogenase I large subunit
VEKSENNFLYLVVLGGRAKKANIEVHDVRWVVGSKIEQTYDTLRKDWFGSSKGLHIDSYKKIKYIDGYKIKLINVEQNKIEKKKLVKKNKAKKYLWFVNIGGYDPTSMQEKHEFGLVTAFNKLEAKNIAKSKWLIGCKKKHKDDIAILDMLITYDDCEVINKIGNWEIELTLDNKFIEENNYPDWYGYQLIDGK